MKNQKPLDYSNIVNVTLIVLLAAFSRLIPHPPNFTPLAAIALFSGSKLKGKLSFIIPLASMFLSDLFLGFHNTMFFVYLSFALITFIGRLLRKYNFVYLLLTTLASSLLFYLITNFGFWLTTQMYGKNLEGLIQSYIMAIPFLKNTLFGDLFYTFSLFYGYRWARTISKKIALATNKLH